MNYVLCLLFFLLQFLSNAISKPVGESGDDDCPRDFFQGTNDKCYFFPWKRPIYMGRGEATKECAKYHPDAVPVEFASSSERYDAYQLIENNLEYEQPVKFWTGGMTDHDGNVHWMYLRNATEKVNLPDSKNHSTCVLIKYDLEGFRLAPAKSCATKAAFFCQLTLEGYEGSGNYNYMYDEDDYGDDVEVAYDEVEVAYDAMETGSTPDYQNDGDADYNAVVDDDDDDDDDDDNDDVEGSGHGDITYEDDEDYYDVGDNCCEDVYLGGEDPWWKK